MVDDPTIVRLARNDEYASVGDLTVWAYASDDPAGTEGYAERLRDARRRAERAELLVAEVNENLVGTVTFAVCGGEYADVARPGEAEFRMLAVAPEARRRGVAAALVHACLQRAGELDCGAVVLSAKDDARSARHLYERLGFQRDPERDWQPVPGVDLLCYRIGL